MNQLAPESSFAWPTAELPPREIQFISSFDSQRERYLASSIEIIRSLSGALGSTGSILELGSGLGFLGRLMKAALPEHASRLLLSDASKDCVEFLNQRLQDRSSALHFPAENIPVDNERFPTVITMNLLDAVADPLAVLREAQRVIAKGGYFIHLADIPSALEFPLRSLYRPDRIILPVFSGDKIIGVRVLAPDDIQTFLEIIRTHCPDDVEFISSFLSHITSLECHFGSHYDEINKITQDSFFTLESEEHPLVIQAKRLQRILKLWIENIPHIIPMVDPNNTRAELLEKLSYQAKFDEVIIGERSADLIVEAQSMNWFRREGLTAQAQYDVIHDYRNRSTNGFNLNRRAGAAENSVIPSLFEDPIRGLPHRNRISSSMEVLIAGKSAS